MAVSGDRARSIFGNEIDGRTYRRACRQKESYERRFGPGAREVQHLRAAEAPAIGAALGVRELVEGEARMEPTELGERPVVIGTIRMGFGHYRIAMAMASAARAMGRTPCWLDLMAFPDTVATRLISHQNDLYSLGSRLSQKCGLFNRIVWEPMNSEGFRRLSYNASDQKASELMCAPFADLPRDVPFVGTHAWPSQAAVHAGLSHVVNAIPDNWPMALHLAEGSIHTVQTPGAFLGYKALRGMDGRRVLRPMPAGSIVRTGHYVDHEIVSNVEADCARRERRLASGGPVRYLLSVGGAGAQEELFREIVGHLLPYVARDEAALMVNVGDHREVWERLVQEVPGLGQATAEHFGDFGEKASFAAGALDGEVHGVHAFCEGDIFGAVYSTNVLMRCCDVLVTKPGELSFYPVPKLMICHVGGHERWGAVRAAELGDGTYELEKPQEICGFIDLVQAEPQVIAWMCENIRAEKSRGTYDGAYEAVRLAIGE